MKKFTICLLACSLFAAQKTITRGASDDIITLHHVKNCQKVRAMAAAYEIFINPHELASRRGTFAIETLSAAQQKAQNPAVKQGIGNAITALQKIANN